MMALRDAFPVTEGHSLVIPRRHVRSIFELSANELEALWCMVSQVREMLAAEGIEGFNIGVNDGVLVGQTIDHAHVHVIPRRSGDVLDPRGGVRNIIPAKASYWESESS
jgi:diadenosine tetraphosphate (Ap4A) HIT family hydrolase